PGQVFKCDVLSNVETAVAGDTILLQRRVCGQINKLIVNGDTIAIVIARWEVEPRAHDRTRRVADIHDGAAVDAKYISAKDEFPQLRYVCQDAAQRLRCSAQQYRCRRYAEIDCPQAALESGDISNITFHRNITSIT